MSDPKQVVHVIGRMGRGGVECWLMEVLRRIDRTQFQFTFCPLSTSPGEFDEEIRSLGGTVAPCRIDRGIRVFSRCFRSVLDAIGCEVVHSHVLFFSGVVLRVAARTGVPIRIAHVHTSWDGRSNSLRRRFYRWAMRRQVRKYNTQGIACSVGAADYFFTNRRARLPEYQIMPCHINPSAFHQTTDRTALCESLGIRPEATIVGHVGSFRRAKNHAFLLRIATAMISENRHTHLVLVGDGPLRTDMEELARELGMWKNVTFTGVRADVPVLMTNLFDLFLFPSRFEGLPVAVVESQCAGVPCLVSDVVPAEASVIDELVSFESLRAGPDVWACRALEILRRKPYDKAVARRTITTSRFNIATGVRCLSNLYSGRRDRFHGFDP